MLISDLDLGVLHPQRRVHTGQAVGSIVIYGAREIPYPNGGVVKEISAEIWCQTPGVIGGAAAGSSTGALYLAKQLEELAGNVDLQPAYVQWTSTTGAITPSQDDGFFLLRDLQIDYTVIARGTVHFTVTFGFVSPGPPRRLGVWTSGGTLSSTYAGTAVPWVAFPLNGFLSNTTRTGGEGAVPLYTNPPVNPQPFSPSSTISDWFKCGCRVYDSMSAGGNAVPGAPTFLNSNWIEVKGPDHHFVGDVIITNGLILWVLNVGSASVAVGYLWNMALGTPGWSQFCSLIYNDSTHAAGTLRQVSLTRVGMEEVALTTQSSLAATGSVALVGLRLQRGAYTTRVEFRPQSQANSVVDGLALQAVANQKIAYNGSVVIDVAQSGSGNVSPSAIYGYGASLVNNASYSFIMGWLYQNPPAGQPSVNGTNMVQLGDSSGPAANAARTYGIFAIPYASIQNLQGEAETGTFTGAAGWTSQAGAGGNSNGLEAKLASGSLVGAINTFGTSWAPALGTYQVWFRIKVTSNASALSQFKFGLYDTILTSYAASVSVAATAVTTSYAWYLGGTVTITGADTVRFRCESTATVATDWFVDEAFLVPTTNSTPYFPQDLWQQFIYSREAVQVRD